MKGGKPMTVPTAKMLRDYLGENYEESDEELIKLFMYCLNLVDKIE